jgi:NAD(P)-dependent dehydrogenase (short-subunit alcohol dehydrogenase family)
MSAHVALVTGGTRGIGRAVAVALARDGYDVAVGYRADERPVEATLADIEAAGRRGIAIRADLGVPGAAEDVLEETVAKLGVPRVVVVNAGRLVSASLLDTRPEDYDVQLEANARGSFFVVQAAARRMIAAGGAGHPDDAGGGGHPDDAAGGAGRIVVVTSDAAVRAYRGLAAYCMSKAAAKMLTEAAAIELAPHGITVNAVAPGTTETDMNRALLADPEQREQLLGSILLGRPGDTADVAAAVSFLVSDRAAFMTGATIAVDGGAAIH